VDVAISYGEFYACGDLAVQLSETPEDAVETITRCVAAIDFAALEPGLDAAGADRPPIQLKAAPVVAVAAFEALFLAARPLIIRYTPAALTAFNALRSNLYETYMVRGGVSTLSWVGQQVVKFMKARGFRCSSQTNPLKCRY
jgi:hypothetical protein